METFADELKNLIQLIKFKGYRRNGCVLYAKYEFFKPECTISELVWGFCHNPCYARRLVHQLSTMLPDYIEIMGKSNQMITESFMFSSFDTAMAQLCNKIQTPPNHISFSTESTNKYDLMFTDASQNVTVVHNATDDDGELWHGLHINTSTHVSSEEWCDMVEDISVSIYDIGSPNTTLLWQHKFSKRASISKRLKMHNNVLMFHPFKHALPLLDVDIRIMTCIRYKSNVHARDVPQVMTEQVFGICSNDFCSWLSESSFELKLCKKDYIRINAHPTRSVEIILK